MKAMYYGHYTIRVKYFPPRDRLPYARERIVVRAFINSNLCHASIQFDAFLPQKQYCFKRLSREYDATVCGILVLFIGKHCLPASPTRRVATEFYVTHKQ